MGGGKGGKPISTIEKRQRRQLEQQLKQQLKESKQREKKVQLGVEVTDSLLSRASKEMADLKVVTQYTLASKLGINLSLAKKVIKALVEQGKLKLVDKSRRVIIATISK